MNKKITFRVENIRSQATDRMYVDPTQSFRRRTLRIRVQFVHLNYVQTTNTDQVEKNRGSVKLI